MEVCWKEFYKTVLGPLELREDKLHDTKCCVGTEQEHICSMANCHHPWIRGVKTASEKMWLCEDYARDNYVAPAQAHRAMDKTFGIAGILVALLCR